MKKYSNKDYKFIKNLKISGHIQKLTQNVYEKIINLSTKH